MCDEEQARSLPVSDWRRAWETSRAEPIALAPVDSLTITYLIDNVVDALAADAGPAHRPARVQRTQPAAVMFRERALDPLTAEQGFAALITVERAGRTHQLLFDAGFSPNGLADNMRRLDLDPAHIEAVVLSHGHWDHVTGLDGLARRLGGHQRLPLVLHPESFTRRRMPVPGHDPFEMPVLSRQAVRAAGFELIEEQNPSFLFDSSVLVTGEIDRTTGFEAGMSPGHQAYRGGVWEPDPAVADDQALVFSVRGRGLVVLTGCGHAGLINLARYAMRLTGHDHIHALVGGFHLTGREPAFPTVIEELRQLKPDVLAPAHCVSHQAAARLATAFPSAYVPNAVGTSYIFGP